jgi:hypothetical protein
MKCLAKSPADRYQTGEDLARDLAGLRASSKTDLQSTAFQVSQIDTMATVPARPTMVPNYATTVVSAAAGNSPSQAARPSPPPVAAPQRKNSGASAANRYVAPVAVALVVMVLGGWFFLRGRNHSTQPTVTAPAPAPVVAATIPTAPVAPPVAAPAEKISEKPKPAASAGKPVEKKAEAKAAPVAPPKAAPKSAETAPVDFDPRALNAKENSRLILDASRTPANLDFTIEMNGKIYFRRSAAGDKPEYDDYLVPPGLQEFHATAHSGDVHKASNTVSAEFIAKKKKTLKIELRLQGKDASAGMPQGLYPDSQLVLTLK